MDNNITIYDVRLRIMSYISCHRELNSLYYMFIILSEFCDSVVKHEQM